MYEMLGAMAYAFHSDDILLNVKLGENKKQTQLENSFVNRTRVQLKLALCLEIVI